MVAGRAGDRLGRRRLFQAGLATFGAASLACALAPSAAALVAARAVQGIGAAAATPAALALLVDAFPDDAPRRRAVAFWTAAAAGGGASGWVLGGVLVATLDWRAIFAVHVPLCLAGAVLAPPLLDESRGRDDGAALDLAGAVTVTAGLALVLLGLGRMEAAGPGEPTAGGPLAAGLALLALFVRIERRAAAPIVPPWALGRPDFALAAAVALVLTATTTPAMFLAILHQQEALGRSALETGLWCAPFNLAVIAGSAWRPA